MSEQNNPILLVVAGTPHSGRGFMRDTLAQIMVLSGHTHVVITAQELAENPKAFDREELFIIFFADKYDQFVDVNSDLVFTTKRDLFHNAPTEAYDDRIGQANEFIDWIRSTNHAYNMNLENPMNKRNANNFPNLNAIMSRLRFRFQSKIQFNVEPIKLMQALDKINPRYERKGQDLTKEEQEQRANGEVHPAPVQKE